MTRTILLVVSLSFAIAACGPETPTDAEPTLLGVWYGTASAATPGGQPVTYSASLEFTPGTEPGLVFALGICPDGSGGISGFPSGNRMEWSGERTCPWPPGPACSTSTLTYTKATAHVSEDGTLVVLAEGRLEGCGFGPFPVDVTFYGRK